MLKGWGSHVAAFAAGIAVTTAFSAQAVPRRDTTQKVDRWAALDTFAEVLAHVRQSYVEERSEKSLIHDALRGLTEGLDRHSSFMPPRKYTRVIEDTDGEFGGLGLTLMSRLPEHGDAAATLAHQLPVVADVVTGSPADTAGISIGDLLLAVDGDPTAPEAATEAQSASYWDSRLRGAAGSKVKLRVQHAGAKAQPRDLELERAYIKIPSVTAVGLADGTAYVAIRRFAEATAKDVAEALDALAADDAGLTGLILDLRANPGGLVQQAVRVADLFVERGTIVSVVGRSRNEVEVAHAGSVWKELPLVVLVNGSTASAAEIVAGALQDHDRAKIVGTKTFGKGTVQTYLDLTDGSGLKITTARYLTPDGRTLEGIGITPDLVAESGTAEQPSSTTVRLATATRTASAGIAGARAGNDARISDRLREDSQFGVAYQALTRLLTKR
jgi:carboxyl-terminal processing protease